MYCKFCGKQIDSDSIFCRYCGKKQVKSDETAPSNREVVQKVKSDNAILKSSTLIKTRTIPKQIRGTTSRYDELYNRDFSPTILGAVLFLLLGILSVVGVNDPNIRLIIGFTLVFLRIFISIWCFSIAKKLNRSTSGWAVFGFILPVVALIVIGFMKKLMDTDHSQSITTDSSPQYSNNATIQDVTSVVSLSESEQREVKKFLEWGIKPNEKLIIHTSNRKIDRVDSKEWTKIINTSEENNWIILVDSSA